LLVVPLAALVIFAFALGLGMLVAAGNVFFRDIEYLLTIALQVWIFMTPIIYLLAAVLYFSRIPRLFPKSAALNRYSFAHADYDAEQELLAGTAACLMVRSDAFRQVGGVDEAFFMCGEDLDLCRRLREAGWRGVYVPSARALHLKGEASRKQSRRMLVEFHRAMWTYYSKHEKDRRPAPINWVVAGGIVSLAGARIATNALRREGRVSAR
jgi:GT2 family glycosyltransferase